MAFDTAPRPVPLNPFAFDDESERREKSIDDKEREILAAHKKIVDTIIEMKRTILREIESKGQEPDENGMRAYIYELDVPFEEVADFPRKNPITGEYDQSINEAFKNEVEKREPFAEVNFFPANEEIGEGFETIRIMSLESPDREILLTLYPKTGKKHDDPVWVEMTIRTRRDNGIGMFGHEPTIISIKRYKDISESPDYKNHVNDGVVANGIRPVAINSALDDALSNVEMIQEITDEIAAGNTHMRIFGNTHQAYRTVDPIVIKASPKLLSGKDSIDEEPENSFPIAQNDIDKENIW